MLELPGAGPGDGGGTPKLTGQAATSESRARVIDDDQTHPPGSRDAPGPSAPQKLVVAGQGYVGLPARHAGGRGRATTWSASMSTSTGSSASSAASRYVEDISDERPAAALDTGRYRATSDPADLAGFDVAVITVPTPLTRGRARPLLHRVGGPHPRPLPPARRDRHPRVDHLPGHHRGAGRSRSSRKAPASRAGERLPRSATAPSASTPATPRGRS